MYVATMSRQSSFGRASCGMLQQRMLQKGRFSSCEQLGSVRPQLTERFNQSTGSNHQSQRHVAVTKHRCEIVWHEELRQYDTLRLHVSGIRNTYSCECV